MPQTIETITVHLAEPPVGIFRDALEQREIDIVGQVLTRLQQISALLTIMKYSEDLHPFVANAVGGVETLVDDTRALLTVIPSRGVA